MRQHPPPDWCVPGLGIEGTTLTISSPPYRNPRDQNRWYVELTCGCGHVINRWVNDLRKPYRLNMCWKCYAALTPEGKRARAESKRQFRRKGKGGERFHRFVPRSQQHKPGMGWPEPPLVDRRTS
jgi:hypothetical protein